MQEIVGRIIDGIPERGFAENSSRPFLIAVDGRCAAGKSTLVSG